MYEGGSVLFFLCHVQTIKMAGSAVLILVILLLVIGVGAAFLMMSGSGKEAEIVDPVVGIYYNPQVRPTPSAIPHRIKKSTDPKSEYPYTITWTNPGFPPDVYKFKNEDGTIVWHPNTPQTALNSWGVVTYEDGVFYLEKQNPQNAHMTWIPKDKFDDLVGRKYTAPTP